MSIYSKGIFFFSKKLTVNLPRFDGHFKKYIIVTKGVSNEEKETFYPGKKLGDVYDLMLKECKESGLDSSLPKYFLNSSNIFFLCFEF